MNKMIGSRKRANALMAVMCAGAISMMALSGCGSDQAADTSAPAEAQDTSALAAAAAVEDSSPALAEPTPEPESPYTIEAGDEAATEGFILDNGLEAKITGIALRPVATEDAESMFAECPFTVGDSLAPDQKAYVRYDAAASAYDLQLTTMSGDVYELHNLPLSAIEGAMRVQISDGIAYATYEQDGAEVDTLASEQEIAASAAAAVQDDYADYSYDAGYDDGYDYSYDAGYDAGAQTGDGCVSDIILN